ncbi:uncharacterized protein col6a3 [Pseudorasbora parva]|uniref:uncharacterized protein col6a3 n=1 Tax=Pseudorasbora parva TaxID=51549 RepID=UPI00351DBAF4
MALGILSQLYYSREAEVHFYLNSYTAKEDVLDRVRGLRHKGGRPLNTGAALQYVRDNVFTASTGSRRLEGVPQILILLSGGRSFDSVDAAASSLKELGVLTFGIGSRGSDSRELQRITYDPNYALSVSDFSELPNVQEQLLASVQEVAMPITPTSPTLTADDSITRKDVVFLLDGSDGTRNTFPAVREFVQRVVEQFNIEPNRDRVSVVQYSRDAEVNFYLNTYATKGEILNTVRGLRHRGGRPLNTGAALQYVRDSVFTASAGSRKQEGVPQILILLSGGRSSDNIDTPASALKESGVLIFGIGTRNSSREVQRIAGDPTYAQSINEFSDLPSVQQQFISSLNNVPVQVKPVAPTVAAERRMARRDVVFLLDGSDGTRSSFPAMRSFVERMVERLNVSENRDRVSVIQYSRDPEAHFYLNTYSIKEDVLDTLRGLRHKGGRPLNTGAALQYVRDNVFTASSGSRLAEGVPQLLILLSGGKSFDNVDTPASSLKELGVLVFAIGSRSSDSRELQKISHEPSYALSVGDFADLPSVQQQLFTNINTVFVEGPSITTTTIAEGRRQRRDVVFLLDGSDATRNGFPAMKEFVQKMVEKLEVAENRDRVSVVQYSRDPEAHFYLNTYTTKEEILDGVRGLRHKGGRPLYTGAALQYVRDNVFTASSGSRRLEGVPQILVLLSGGRSFDSVEAAASSLKELGILTFGIGSRGSDSRELQRISYDPNYALSVSDFTELPNVQEQLLASVQAVSIPITPTSLTVTADYVTPRKDVVFLLDGSDGTRNSFPAIRDFVQRLVEQFTIEANRDRVSVVQYSREAEVHFYLNSYTAKEDVLDRVRGLRHKGGRPLNTGAALQYVRDNVFTASTGSRRLEGVPQILILLSGGRSFDSVDAAASSLKELGVLTFGIGSRGSDSRELQRITYDPNYALSVSDFSELPNVQEQLLASVQEVAMPITPTSPTLTADDSITRKDVVFLLDGSDGTRNTFPAVREFVQRVVEQFNIEPNRDRVSVVQYSRDAEVNFYLNTYATKGEILNTVRGLRHRGGRPLNTGAALQYVRDSVFTASAGSRKQEGVPQILILLSGGRSSDNIDTPASALKESGVLIFGIGTRNSSREVQRIAGDPTYAQSINEFSDLPSVQQQFISSLNNVPVQVKPVPPTVAAERRMARRDVVFLLDGSDGTRSSFPAMRSFVERMVERLNVSENRDRVSVIQYSRDPEAHFYLNTYSIKEDVLDTLRGLRHKGGRPLNTGAALQYVRDNVFTASSGSRLAEGVPQLLILLSGGKSFDNVDTPASSLKELGVLVFAIGSRSSDSRELQKISHEPSYALSVGDFADLPSVQQQLFTNINTVFVEGPSITTTTIAEGRRQRRDVVFLLDGSDATRNGFPAMKEFVQKMVEKLEVAENRDRVSVVQYSRDPEAHFYLNTYTTKEEILDGVRGLRHKGGRPLYTGAALQYVRDNVFTASSGSRRLEGVPQILVLLSGGRSFDSVEAAASSLKELGILTFGIGSRGSDSRELQRISYDPNYALSVSDFTELPNVQEQLLASVQAVSIPITPTSLTVTADYVTPRKDVVFLLDGSDGTRNSFPAIRDFVQRLVEQFTIEANRDRVSVVQYSREAEVHFYLNSYTAKEDVLDRVRGLRHKGGRPLNTGAALQYVRDNVFTASTGSRRLEGVPQILILLSGGRSFDSVDAAASSLKELGVLTFGIGSRGSDSRELQRITYDPNYALSVSDFSELPNVQEQLLASVQEVAMPITPTSPTLTADDSITRKDVVFLLDGSDGTRNTFPAVREFVQRVVEQFNIEPNRDRVSVVQYSRDAEVNFYLNTYATKGEILNTVRGLRHRGGRPLNTGAALQYVRDSVFTASAGSRKQEGVPQILILLSGGRSSDNIDTPASALKESGVLIFGIGTRNSSREVQRIAGDPTYAQSINEFSDLPSVQQQFISSLNNVPVQVKPVPPTVAAERRMARRDVVFLLDGSDGTRSSFPAMRSFVERMVERLNVSENRDRVSVIQYSRDPEAHFYLNTYSIKEDVLDTLRGLRHKGGRPLNTGAALQYVRDNVFTASSGSRLAEGVPQLLILLSGGKSFDNVDTPASSLKELGVLVFAIGSRSSDSRELQKISHEPSYALSVGDFADLPSVQQQLFTNINTVFVEGPSITTTTIAEGRRQRRDVVFLLDGSDATRNGFPAMKEFVQKMVEKLEVAENRDRVSVVQYSRDPEAHFYLNTYTTKEEILDGVRGLRHKGGRPLYTGAALQYVRDNVFTASSGSRRLEGVPQILVLLSGGRSFDSVEAAASSLKELGILTFGIGSRGSDSRELQRISYDPNYALSVSDFTELPNVQEQLLASVQAVSIPITPTSLTVTADYVTPRKDVVFLLDGSDGTRNSFPAIRDFVQRLVEQFTIEANRDRVSVVQYSREAEVHFYLNSYTAKEDVLDRVRGLRHKGGRPLNTGAALQYVRDNVFTASTGSRRLEGVPQILILLSGGRSFDSVDAAASSLKELGVLTFGIGSRGSDSRELQRITYDPNYALSVSDFSELPNVQEQLLASVQEVAMPITPTSPTLTADDSITRKDVVFLLDGSDGTRNTFPAVREFVQRVVEQFNIEPNRDRVSVVQYSRDAEVNFYLNTYATKGEILNTVRGLRHRGGRPLNTGAALQYVRDSVFTASAGSRKQEGVPQILILLSGGRSSDNIDTPASALKESGVLIFGIGTRNSSREVQRIAGDPTYAQSINEFSDLPSVQQQFISSLNNVPVQVKPVPPTVAAERRMARRDVVFLLDGSDGTRSSFPAMRSFVERMVERLNVSENRDRVSVIQYSRDPEAHFYLNTYSIKEDVLDTLRGLRHKGGRPLNTGAALQYVRDNVFTASSGSRLAEGVPQLLILLSGGKSFDNVDTPASSLKELGVLVFAIGSRSSDSRELQKISHEPSYALSVGDFADLPSVQQQLFTNINTVFVEGPSITTTTIAEGRRQRRDVVFLLDGSDATRNGFPAMKEFVQKMVEKLEVAENRDRVSVVQYSRDPEAHFYLNTYTTKEEILDGVRGLRHKGGRPLYTGAALQYVRDNVFTASSGSRRLEGVPQILVLLSGGRSFDSVEAAASSLKELGILTFGIGSRGSDSRELQRISYDPNYALSVSDFTELPNVQEQLLASVQAVSIPITPTSLTVTADYVTPRKDVVFLLDGSDGTRNSFPAIRDFVQRLVEQFTIEANRDRVSVVQYSREAEVHFYLNSYTAKEDVLDRVRGLRHKGGRPLNTGAALQYVRDNVFTASTGSRRLEGVPQILILLSGGRSFDSVDAAASSLKELGVLTFGIGSRGSDSRELQRITYDPNYALSVSDFSELPNVQEQLLASVQEVAMPITPTSPTLTADDSITRKDVVFLLDGSDGTRNTFPAVREFVQRVVEQFNIEPNRDRVSVVQYSRDAEVNFYLNTYATKGEILNTVRGLRHRGGRPLNTGAALQYVRDSVFTASAGSRKQEGVPQILILLSGGRSSDNIDTPASALKESGVLIFGIGTRNSSREVQRIAGDPTYAQSINEFSDLPSVQQQFISSLNNVPVQVKPVPPTVAAERRMARRDVVFLLDGSDGTRSSFPAMRSFVERMVERLNVSENRDRVSVIQYSRDPEAHFYLNTYSIKEDVLDTLRGLRHKGGRPLNTGAALQYVRDNVFTASSGSRLAEGVPQLLILLSGGKSFDNVDTPASSLKELGVLVFAIGSRSSDSRELQKISHEPSYALSVGDFADLPSVQQQLFTNINTVFVEGPSITTTTIAEGRRQRRDVVFLLDGSDATRNGFPAMKEFVQKMVEKLEVAENRDRVSVVQYSRDPEAHFYLNTYTTKEEILDGVRGLRHKGGRPLYTGAALQYVRDNVFTASSGSRRLEGVPQILVLLSGGRSFDSVEAAASSLKELGILTFGIGSRGSDSRELQRISYDPNYALSVSDFTELPNVQEQLLASVQAVSIPITPTSLTVTADYVTPRKDVVFLLDGSDGTRNSFPAIRDFVQRLVEQFTIEANRDRVSVVQYSREAEVHFYLNSYTAKEDVLDRVRGLRHKGGRPLNTGAALQYVRDNVFTASTGSRRLEGVPQILILLSGGRSFDSVDAAASSLKELGVLTFGIGSRGSDSRELQRITYDPNYALSVSDFSELPNVQEQLLASVQEVAMPITPTSPTLTADDSITRKDVVFLLDGSDGTRNTFPAVREFVQSVVEQFNIEPNRDRVSVVQYSRDAEVNFYLNTYATKGEILNTVRGLRHRGGRPLNTGAALQYVRDSVFTASAGSRKQEGVPQILILLSGGRSSDNIDTPASALKESGVLIFGIGTRNSSREVQRIAGDPTYAQSINEFSDLPSVQQQFISSLNNVPVQVKPVAPTVAAERRMARRDVVFLLDGSDGTRSSFPAMRSFVERMVERLNVSENRDRVSVIQYSRDPEAHFYLNTYSIKEDVLDTLRGLRHKGGRPLNTGAALQYVRDNVFTASSGSRLAEGVPQLLILLSGGKSFDNVDTPASSLKELGVLVFAIGSRSSDSRELQKISHEPSYALSVGDFADLPSVQQQLFTNINTVFVEGPSITTTTIAEGRRQRRDVVFLLDGSDATRNGFPAMKEFVQKMVEKLEVAENRDRVSVVQYSRDPEAHFYLNTYTTKEEILDGVRGLRHKGGRPLYTGAALQYVRDNVFTASSGSRRLEGVPQILVLLSGGRSFDSVEAAASSLKELGILTFGIGSRGSDSRELQRISYDPNYALSVSDFTELPNVQEQLLASVQAVSIPITPTSLTVTADYVTPRKDVVFLLDGSDGTRNSFPAIRDFVQRLVEQFTIEANRDRVSVVQYSREAEVHFYLNSYTAKEDVLDRVRGLRHKGGRPLNTGAALQYVRDNVFTASTGSRRLEGVPQILILLSGGRSFDSVDAAASSLKELGVLTFGIGSRGSDSRELQRITYDPNYALSVSDFSELPNVQEQLLASVQEVAMPITPTSPTLTADDSITRKDVVFLLDGSDGTRNTFPAVREFVQRVVEQFNIEPNRDRVSVVQYSRDAEVNFYLNTYATKGEILNTVRGLRHRGGRPLNTGAALQYVRDSVFTASAGSRKQEGVPQILILLSGGRSSDNIDTPASALKESGVLIFGIGTRNSSREVQRIAGDPTYAQSINEFSDLPSVQQQFISSLNNVPVQVKPVPPTVAGKIDSHMSLENSTLSPPCKAPHRP